MTVGNVVLAVLTAAIVLTPLVCHEIARAWPPDPRSRTTGPRSRTTGPRSRTTTGDRDHPIDAGSGTAAP